MNDDADRHARLVRAKLAALTRDLTGAEVDPVTVGSFAAAHLDSGVVISLERGAAAEVGAALVWATRHEARSITLFVDSDAGVAARLGAQFPDLVVREVIGSTSIVADADPFADRPDDTLDSVLAGAAAQDADAARELIGQVRSLGLDVVVEHDVVRVELCGLEVARLVEWPQARGGDGQLHLEAGVGRFDRDAIAAVHPDEAPLDSLARTVEMVRPHRRKGATSHAVSLLSRERWLRSTVMAQPDLVGAASLRPTSMTTEPDGLRDRHPAAAIGESADGTKVLVVCSIGADLSLVPLAAETRQWLAPGCRLVLAVPHQDLFDSTAQLAAMLRPPAELVGIDTEWV